MLFQQRLGTKLRGQDLNLRPRGYEPRELPGCSTPRPNLKLAKGQPQARLEMCREQTILSAAAASSRGRSRFLQKVRLQKATPILSASSPQQLSGRIPIV